MQIVYCYVNS